MTLDKLKGYKTLIVNVLTLVIVVGGALTGQITDPTTLRYIAIVLAGANVVLRFVTDSPVFKGGSV